MSALADRIVRDFLIAEVQNRLEQCTLEQQAFFIRMYPEGIEKMTEAKLRNAVDQCQRTIDKNQKEVT